MAMERGRISSFFDQPSLCFRDFVEAAVRFDYHAHSHAGVVQW